MVFEAVVVDVLNRFLGNYVENLNSSQLKIGIWGGDVVLENLILKQNALEELNIPVQTVYGHLGKLVLKIPWKNLYGASVEASVEKLFLIVNPTAEVRYDAEKEEKMALASKQAELARVEEAKKKEAEKDEPKVDDTFVEKLVTQIIKNVQLKIKDIHIRYEDSITNPNNPFSCGLTLHNLSVHTTDENWKQTVIQEAVTKIFKILNLEGLAVYWNPSTKIYSKLDKSEIVPVMHKEIATKASQPDYLYLLGPINATAKLKLNPKPEADEPRFSIPKCILTLHMEQLKVSINKAQYQDVMMLADSMSLMSKGAPYRKYRPFFKSYRGHYKAWWQFAYQCVLEEEVRRKRKNWDWEHMWGHRCLCKEYAKAYQSKLSNKGKVNSQLQDVLNNGEKHLDLFNLVVIRQQIEMEVARLGKLEEETKKNRGWFGGWFGGRTAKDDELSENTAIMKQFENAMTPEEKSKLFRAIDYQENSAPLHLPAEFVAVDAHFTLDRLQVSVTDAMKQVLCAMVDNVEVGAYQRPGADAIKVEVQMQKFSVLGVKQEVKEKELVPNLVSSTDLNSGASLLNVTFETNPLSNDCSQRVLLSARPLQIVYDAQTIIEIVNVFKPPAESSALEQLQAAAENKLSDLKEKSALSVQHAVSRHTFIDIDINIAASHIIVPHSGIYTEKEPCLVVKLGAVGVKSEPRSQHALNVHQMFKEGLAEEEILRELIEHSYDKLQLNLTDIQAVISGGEEDWRSAITGTEATPMHLLQPTTLSIQIHKCLLTDDPRLPKVKVTGELQQIAVNAFEDRLLTLLEVLVSIPLPQSDEAPHQLKPSESKGSNLSLFKYLDPNEKKKREMERPLKQATELATQLTELEAFFLIKGLTLNVCRKVVDVSTDDNRLLRFCLDTLELKATQKTFTLEAAVNLGSIALDQFRPDGKTISLIETRRDSDTEGDGNAYLFTVTYCNVDKRCPDFRSYYGSVEQLIVLEFTTLKLLLHLEGLKQILVIANDYQQRIQSVQSQKDRIASAGDSLPTIMEDEVLKVVKSKTSVPPTGKRHKVESIQLKVKINVGSVSVRLETERRPLADLCVLGLHAGLVMKHSYTQLDCALQDISIVDLNPHTIHTQILKVLEGDVINVRVVLYNVEQFPAVSDTAISIDAQINCLRFVFLNWFLSSVLDFTSNFQAAQQALIDASAVAADAARANVESAFQNSTKVSLKVRLKAPIIIAPENSTSDYALMLDLGQMSIHNTFFDLDVDDSQGKKVTVDDLTVALQNMKVSAVRLSGGDADERERLLLRPTSFSLIVKRSLSGWYEALPDLDVSGRLKTIAITIRPSDFAMVMRVLNENLKEGQDQRDEPPKSKPVQKTTAPKPAQLKASKSLTRTRDKKEQKVPRTTIKFAFTMDSLVIDLINTTHTGSSSGHLNVSENSAKSVGLARFCLSLLSLKGRMLSDESMHTSVLLVDCTLDDMRPARGGRVTRYFERRSGALVQDSSSKALELNDKIRSMIDVTYTMKNSDTFIDVRIFSFNLILAVDFLMKIAEFLTPKEADAAAASAVADAAAANAVALTATKSDTTIKKKSSQTAAPKASSEPSMMTINLKVEKPDIILVESLEQKESEALIMNTEVTFKMRMTAERMVVDGAISQLQLYTRSGWGVGGGSGAGEADPPPHYLLEPCSVSLAAAQPPQSGMHVDLAVSNIKINVSPETIGLLNRVLVTMTKSEDDDSDEENTKIYTYRDLWSAKPFSHNSYWFLNTEIGEDALSLSMDSDEPPAVAPPSGEICLMSSPSITLSLEVSIGTETIPVLVMQAALSAQVRDWSSELNLESTWSMQVMYYNIARALWEPLIEPVEVLKDNMYKHEPWDLKMEVVIRKDDPFAGVDMTDEAALAQAIAQAPPSKSVLVTSTEPLEITMTSTCMEVLTHLGNSFSAAMAIAPDTSADKTRVSALEPNKHYGAPYVLHNCTGLTAQLLLDRSDDFAVFSRCRLTTPDTAHEYKEVLLEPGASVPLQLKKAALNLLTLEDNLPQFKLYIKIVELGEELCVPVERADKRYFPLGQRGGSGAASRSSTMDNRAAPASTEPRGLISEISMHDGAINIYLRSVVQVKNSLSVPVCVYYMTASGNEVHSLGDVAPGDILRLPLQAAHTPTSEIFFSVEDFTVSVSPFIWRELQQEVTNSKLLQCDSKDKTSAEKFYIKAVGAMEQVYLENTNRRTLASSCYSIVLLPAVKLQNCLPVDVLVSQLGVKRTQLFRPGEMFPLSHLSPHSATIVVMLQDYMEKCWVCTKQLPERDSELSVWSFDSHDSPEVMTLDLGMHSSQQDGTQALSLYCPFWMLNKTGLTLAYRKSKKNDKGTSNSPKKASDESSNVLHHRADNLQPVLFSFRAKNFFGKKKASIRVEFGEWSDKFSLDVAGSSGEVLCKSEGKLYQVAVTNQLTFNSLTKMVVFTPFFLIINECPFPVECQELHRAADKWLKIEGKSSSALWPASEREDKLLLVRVAGSTVQAHPFLYTEQHTTTLKLNNEYGGLHVETQLSEGGTYITIRQYRDGLAPALIINYSPQPITLYEKENVNVRKLEPMFNMLYSWENPAGPRVLIFEGHKKKEIENDLRKDGIGKFTTVAEAEVFWVSFLDGLQRVILFTENEMLAHGVHTAGESGRLDMELSLSVQGVGLSLVNDVEHQEIIYISISNSGIVWEQCKVGARRYKKVDEAKVAQLEEAYQRYMNECLVAKTQVPGRAELDSKTEVDFAEMRQLRPSSRLLRRTLEPGLWASYGMSQHIRRLHARLHRLQIDQQLPLPTFPVILAPVPPPRSVAAEGQAGMKPFVEVSIVERVMEHSKVRQYKYYKILVQEFHVKVDMGLINALMEMFPQKPPTEQEALERFALDIQTAAQPLEAVAAQVVASDQKHFYDILHLSPLKVHVSFSLGGATTLPTFVGTVLQSIGVTLTDMNDVIFKLAYYERKYEFLSQKELVGQASSHYTGQAIKQLYVLVLGLDVIGNPYGLVVGLKQGVEDLFYEPFQGAIQGPGEFAEGLFLGVRSLVGHTVGGAAGAVSRIAGAMGHGLAALSLDKDYQRRRRDNMNKAPANLQEGLARSGKGLVMGVVDGVTGVFTKPISGAREEGVEGFFKGLGKGAVGLVARPTAGVVDFASGSLNAVKRVADMSEEVTRQRPARYLPADSGVRPYSRIQADGYKLLTELEKGKFVATDTYATHVWVVPAREVALCTDKRLLYLEKNTVFGGWQIVWTYLWTELPDAPYMVDKGVMVPIVKKKVFGMFPSSSANPGKLILIYDDQRKKYLHAQCERLMRAAR